MRHVRLPAAVVLVLAVIAATASAEPVATRTFALHPGWNAVFLDVQPEPSEPAAVFAGLPVNSVWTWLDRNSTVEFIQNPGEGLWGLPGWSGYFTGPQHAFLSNLHAVLADRPYLVELGGTADATLTVTGRPTVRDIIWAPDAFNLTGFAVDPDNPPTFAAYFQGFPAHAGQPLYRLSAAGAWESIADTEVVEAGAAYWAWCEGSSSFQGPLAVTLPGTGGLDYGTGITQLTVGLRNLATATKTVSLALHPSDGPTVEEPALSVRTFDEQTGLIGWQDLAGGYALDLEAGERRNVTLGVRRESMAGTVAAGTLVFSDGAGSRIPVPATVARPAAGSYAGLWSGDVTLDAVSRVNEDPPAPVPTPAKLRLRLLLHVDAGGTVKLLKEAIQMKSGATGEYVLLADHLLVPGYEGVALRGGEPVGRRISAVGFDFEGTSVACAGAFPTGTVGCGVPTAPMPITLAADHPTNPFRHRAHPDHDNLDPRDARDEVYEIGRAITLTLDLAYPPGAGPEDQRTPPPGWGESTLGGRYEETLTGLHREPIAIAGTFTLNRVAPTATLTER